MTDPAAPLSADKSALTQARKPRGFPDRRADQLAAESALTEAVTGVYKAWGFEPLETGAFEYVEALGKFLPDTDRPNEGVFALLDDDAQWIALRYDLTAPLARFAAEHWNEIPKPFRRYAVGPVWRNEKPGPGRFREFLQCDADTVGAGGAAADAEMIAMAAEAMTAAGLGPGEFAIKVNTRRLLNGVLDAIRANSPEARLTVLRALDKLDRLGIEGVADLLGQGRMDASGDFTTGAGLAPADVARVLAFAQAGRASRGQTLSALEAACGDSEEGRAGLEELAAIDALVAALGASEDAVQFDPSIVRGLEYYTGPVFEAELLIDTPDEKGRPARFGSVGGGGRYDGLVARFRAEPAPATGFSVGISRFAAALAARRQIVLETGPVVILAFDKSAMTRYFAMARELRAAGIRAEVYVGGAGLKAQMKYADRRGAPAVVIEGESEREAGIVQIKDLARGAELAAAITDNREWREERPGQIEAPRAALVAAIQSILKR
jgi:histidyl-tRNA synthetase